MNQLYQRLTNPIKHNATQPSKQPLTEPLNELMSYLDSQSFADLSIQQIEILEHLGVDGFMGPRGSKFVDSVVRISDFDPATAQDQLNEAIEILQSAYSRLRAVYDSIYHLELDLRKFEPPSGRVTLRLGFQHDASIDHFVDWKASAAEWHDIVRGLGMAAGEAPEETKIIGAETGSVILIATSTVVVSAMLALVVKNVTSMLKSGYEIAHAHEDLKRKKLLNKVIEKELEQQQKELKSKFVETALKEVGDLLERKIDGDAQTALERAVAQLFSFSENGGIVDFVTPKEVEPEGEEEGAETTEIEEIETARSAIRQLNLARDEMRLLTNQAHNDDDPPIASSEE